MCKSKNKIISVLLFAFAVSLVAAICIHSGKFAFAENTEKTVSQITYTMENGAYIYSNNQTDKRGIRFGATMSESDYNALMSNVGEGKAYKSIEFGVLIAPSDYETKHGAFTKENVFGESAIYDWAIWDDVKGWVYTESAKTRIINIYCSELKIDSAKASCYGAITTILPENLLNPFKGIAYIAAEKNQGGFDYAFASESDNERTSVYVAQRRREDIKAKIAELDSVVDAEEIEALNNESEVLGATYLTDAVKNTDANYTVQNYYKKPNGEYFLFETTNKTAKIDSALNAETASGSSISGVTFEKDNGGNESPSVVYAQNKSLVKAYYDVAYGGDSDNKETIYDLSSTSDYVVDNSIISVYSDQMEKISDENKTIPNSTIVNMGNGEHDLYVLTANGFEKYSTVMATHAISTKDEFIAFLSSYSGNSSKLENNKSNTYYAVLATDIDLTGVTLPGKSYNNDRFFGKFNGLGHCIKNPTVNASGGIFGGLQNCTIENLAIDGVNITNSYASYAILAGYLYPGANVSNVYVKATISQPSVFRGLFNNMQHGTISNIVADITYSGSSTVGKFVFGVYDGGEPTGREQIYGIGNAAGYLGVWDAQANNYVLEEGGTIYSNAEAFFDANRDVVSAENGFSKYWVKTENSLKFGELTIYSK